MAKIRNGFVSNSSSSSFVITGKCDDSDAMKVTIDLSSMGTIVRNENELKTFMNEEYGFEEDEYENNDKVTMAREAFKNGQVAFFGNIDNDAVGILQYLSSDFKVEYDY